MNTTQHSLEQLRDIKPIVMIPDYSLYYLFALIAFVLVLIAIIIYKYKSKIRKTKQPSEKELLLEKLNNLDYTNTKEIAYSFSVDCKQFLDEQNQEKYDAIEKQLIQYKYKKEVEPLSKELEQNIKEFIKGLK